MTTIILLGTCDTKGHELSFLAERIVAAGCTPLVVDAGIGSPDGITPDIDHGRLAEAAGTTIAELHAAADRGTAVTAMGRGAAQIVGELAADGRVDGLLSVGGSGGTSIAAAAAHALPIGVPKLIASTVFCGDVSSYVGNIDLSMMYSVVDIAGINRISARILANAAAAICGMARQGASEAEPAPGARPLVAATMFGVTTAGVTAARERLEELGYEVVVFHATGTGGRAMEDLIRAGFFDAVLDLTTTEIADEIAGGMLSAGPNRLEAASIARIPAVVAPGAVDMANFWAPETIPATFSDRLLHRHNPEVTLMRTTAAECRAIGEFIAAKLRAASSPTTVMLPLGGVSAIDIPGQVFFDPVADKELFTAIEAGLADSAVAIQRFDTDINDPAFARAAADELHRLITQQQER